MTKNLIILAKVEMTGTRPTGQMIKRDMNWFPQVEAAPEAKSLVYSSDESELEAGKQFAAREGWHCWLMPDAPDVLNKARERALDEFRHQEAESAEEGSPKP